MTLSPPKSATPECLLRAKIAQTYLKLEDPSKALEHLEKVDVGVNSQLEPNTSRAAVWVPTAAVRKARNLPHILS